MNNSIQFCPICGGKNLDIEPMPRDEEVWYYPDDSEQTTGQQLQHPVEVSCDDCNAEIVITDGTD